nr:RNA-directed DNA polymerase, eukaryota [Tanacetum cinerariifolium]
MEIWWKIWWEVSGEREEGGEEVVGEEDTYGEKEVYEWTRNIVDIGNQLGFDMNNKDADVARILANGDHGGLQEPMARNIDRISLQAVWGNSNFEFASKNSKGKSGGIISIWDPSKFTLQKSVDGDGFLALSGTRHSPDTFCNIIVVYDPQCLHKKKKLWHDLRKLYMDFDSLTIIMGDFNEVRADTERLGTTFCHQGAINFNDFISSSGLFDLSLCGLRQNRSRINGLNILGSWVSEPPLLKDHIFQVFKSNFKEENTSRPSFTSGLFKTLTFEDSCSLDLPIAVQEIKDAVWDCGGDKAPGPDGFSFKFIKAHWDIVSSDIISYIREFESSSFIPKGCPLVSSGATTRSTKILANRLGKVIATVVSDVQMAFIKGRQIMDGHLLVNEIIAWAKILKWRSWILACLCLGYTSVLINGSPTPEFKLERGLRQGDPLFPFLFILAVEALNVALLEARAKNLFRCVEVGIDKINISHLQYADDALIMGEWSLSNAKKLSRILSCFHLASGLIVNFNKSRFYGVGVSHLELNSLALAIGGRLTLTKAILGSLGVYFFSTFKDPKSITKKLESIRRNFFWGGCRDEKKIAWIAWDKVISPLDQGSFGIGSLKICNKASLSKWWWRFFTEENSIWSKSIRSLLGPPGGLHDSSSRSKSGPWYQIARLKEDLIPNGINLSDHFSKNIGNDESTKFWLDKWLGGSPLSESYPRLFRLDLNQHCLVRDRAPTAINTPSGASVTVVVAPVSAPVTDPITVTITAPVAARETTVSAPILGPTSAAVPGLRTSSLGQTTTRPPPILMPLSILLSVHFSHQELINLVSQLHLSSTEDKWVFNANDSYGFSMKVMILLIMNTTPASLPATRWNCFIPIKINTSTWRVLNERLSNRYNHDMRGIDLHTVRCPICDDGIEMEFHLFCQCKVAIDTWIDIFKWWNLNNRPFSCISDVVNLADQSNLSAYYTPLLVAVVQTTIWVLWRFRNESSFGSKRPKKELILNDIKLYFFTWIS